jgi:hypothetical protein
MTAMGKTFITSLAVLGVAALTACAPLGEVTGQYEPRQPTVTGPGGVAPASTMTTASPDAPRFNTTMGTSSAPPSMAPAPAATAEAPAPMAPVMLTGTLDGTKEVPINFSTAVGRADATYDQQTQLLTWTVSFQGLSGPAAAAHFHGPAEPGSSAGVQVNLGETGLVSPLQGSATLTPEQASELTAGLWYVNIHTVSYPDGEIRGWVKPEGMM